MQGVPPQERAAAVPAGLTGRPSAATLAAGASPGHPAGPAYAGRRAGIAFIALSAIAFGSMAIMARFAFASGVDLPTLLALRFVIAALCMTALLAALRERVPRGADLGRLALLGAVGYGGQSFSFFTALTLAPAGLTALLLYLYPAMVAVLAALFLHEPMTRRKLGALALALAGTTLTVAPALAVDADARFPHLPMGIAYGIAAAVIYSIYIVAGDRITRRVAPLAMATVVVTSAAAVFVAVALARGPQWPRDASGWLAIAGIALVSTVAAITLFFAGLARIGPTRASTLSTIEPVVTVALAALLLGERIGWPPLIGGALILAAVPILAGESPATGNPPSEAQTT